MCKTALKATGYILLLIICIIFSPVAVAWSDYPGATLQEYIVPDQAITQVVWDRDARFFFEGKAGEVITLKVTGKTSGLDPYVSLINPETKEASDDDGGGHGNSLIENHVLKRSGRYIVSVGTVGGSRGKVEVLLRKKKATG